MHFVSTELNIAWLVYYRIQWENPRCLKTFGLHCILLFPLPHFILSYFTWWKTQQLDWPLPHGLSWQPDNLIWVRQTHRPISSCLPPGQPSGLVRCGCQLCFDLSPTLLLLTPPQVSGSNWKVKWTTIDENCFSVNVNLNRLYFHTLGTSAA